MTTQYALPILRLSVALCEKDAKALNDFTEELIKATALRTALAEPEVIHHTKIKDADMKKKVLDAMVNKFLCWRLPDDFAPDNGIKFLRGQDVNWWPVGTNLFTADQAKAMFEHCLGDALEVIRSKDGTKDGNPVDELLSFFRKARGNKQTTEENKMTNYELALKIAHTEIWPIIGPSNEDILELVKRYDAAKLEAMQPEVKETITLLRNLAGPDPYDERPTMHADLLYKAADMIERLATAKSDDSVRLEWLMRNVSGKEFRRLGVTYGGNCGRDRIDAAMATAQTNQKGESQ